jgi:photosystem II stability/assembly factor-like uncharacterized protein
MKRILTVIIGSVLLFQLPSYASDYLLSNQSLMNKTAMKSHLASKSLLLDIEKISEDKLVVVGEYGHILLSDDGEKWEQANVPVQSTLTAVSFYNDTLGWAVGHDATILHTVDGGKSWNIQHNQPELEKPLLDVLFKNPQEGIAIGAYGLVLRTIDGGNTWNKEFHDEFLSLDDKDYLDELKAEDTVAYDDEVAFILPHFNRLVKDSNNLYLLGEVGLIAKSSDFGVTWHKFDEIYQGSFYDLGRTQSKNLLAVGLRGNIFRDTGNSAEWEKINSGTTALLNDVVFGKNADVFILGNNGTVLFSNDNGETFRNQIENDGKALIAGVWFHNQLIVVSEIGVKIVDFTSTTNIAKQ